MAAAFEESVAARGLAEKVSGWVNIPADCVRSLKHIHLHAARPAGVNEPTAEGVFGSTRILEIVSRLNSDDICVVLLSGGGSALLPAPAAGISLEDKQAVTRLLMQSGATINELNCVRKQISAIKGGKLALRSKAGLTVTLIISDVVGDPLDVIASGPTVSDTSSAADAIAVLKKYADPDEDVPATVWDFLRSSEQTQRTAEASCPFPRCVHNHVIGSNRIAMQACESAAREMGYAVHSLGSDQQGVARDQGVELVELCRRIRDRGHPVQPPVCVLSGGEPVVHLAKTDQPRKGGRNQELVLAALAHLWDDGMAKIAILSGGTDGEDGPTDAAGAFADAELLAAALRKGIRPDEFLAINNSYPFFQQIGGLLKTGPTQTNVMDLRVALISDT